MRYQFTLASQQSKCLLGQAFWKMDQVMQARKIVFCKSTTCALMLRERFSDFDPAPFVAGLVQQKGLCLSAQFPPEVLVEGDQWSQVKLAEIRDSLTPSDLVVKSANVYGGKKAGLLVMSEDSLGTLGVISPDLCRPPRGTRIRARLWCPVIVEKMVPEDSLVSVPRPENSYGWPARLQVFEPDFLFDETAAFRVLLRARATIMSRGSTVEGLAATTFQIEIPDDRVAHAEALVQHLLTVPQVAFKPRECGPACVSCRWGRAR